MRKERVDWSVSSYRKRGLRRKVLENRGSAKQSIWKRNGTNGMGGNKQTPVAGPANKTSEHFIEMNGTFISQYDGFP